MCDEIDNILASSSRHLQNPTFRGAIKLRQFYPLLVAIKSSQESHQRKDAYEKQTRAAYAVKESS